MRLDGSARLQPHTRSNAGAPMLYGMLVHAVPAAAHMVPVRWRRRTKQLATKVQCDRRGQSSPQQHVIAVDSSEFAKQIHGARSNAASMSSSRPRRIPSFLAMPAKDVPT